MSSPQLENGYTRIANEILDNLCKFRVPGEARQVLDAIIRKTYGYNKKEDRISLSQICELTALKRSKVCRALNTLGEMKLIHRVVVTGINTFGVNKNFEEWVGVPKRGRGVPSTVQGSPIKGSKVVPKMGHTIERKKYTKDIAAVAAKKKHNHNPQGAEVINAFIVVDPKNKTYFNNTTQRLACDFLISEYGLEAVLKRIQVLPQTNKTNFFPKINSPNDLKEKWVKLQDQVDRYREERKTKTTKIIR